MNPIGGAGHGRADLPAFAGQQIGITSILLQTAILMGFFLLLVRRFSLGPGAGTLLLTVNGAMMSLPTGHYQFVPAWVITGLATDLAFVWIDAGRRHRLRLRVVAFGVPALLFGLYFLTVSLTSGIGWTVHLWTGAIVLAGIVGLLVSYLVFPSESAE